MTKIGVFFGTTTGKTEGIADLIVDELDGLPVVCKDIAKTQLEELTQYDVLIIGCPTWDIGQLQSDWEAIYDDLDKLDFSGKKVAYFGTGDQYGYADNFMDAIGILEEKISSRGGQTVGYWSTDGYEFNQSRAVRNGKFVGLAIDEDNQPELTEERVKRWTAQLKQELGL
ncbi:MAG: flavodoxin FldA [Pseudanabaenaceae cyanobacterium SKYGB_i_bin29]|nr:flavodoxin FldA [Pseudanabaenaceae cyanobacterium SKYG29]MDW8421367.1 flavodoxin FldA [Pseudanabaenaceae cyanobacterium SKYGB_i_bin29]